MNSDCHCGCLYRRHYMQRVYIYFISPCLVLSCLELTTITIVIIGMTLYELVLHYNIISCLMFFYLFCWFVLHSILLSLISNRFNSILFYFILKTLNLIDWIRFYWIRFTILFSIVSHINEWFVSICLFVRPSVCLSVCVFICMSMVLFSLLFFSLHSFLFLFPFLFSLISFFSHELLPHTHSRTHAWTHTYIWIYVPSYDSSYDSCI